MPGRSHSGGSAAYRLVAVTALAGLAVAGCGGGAATSADPAGHPTAAPGTPQVIDCGFDQPAVRPAHLILACADLGAQVENISWTSWGPDRAEGTGTERDNTCDPNCAAGHFVTKPVRVTLSGRIDPGNVFTTATTVDESGGILTRPMTKR